MNYFIPIAKNNAAFLGFNENIVVSVNPKKNKPNPVVMRINDTGEYFLGDLVKDKIFNLYVLYTGKNQTEPICLNPGEAVIEGTIISAVPLKQFKDFQKTEK